MAIPEYERQNPLSQAPKSPVSAAEIAAPHTSLAKALNNMGASLEDVAEQSAVEAGQQAVTRDENGNLVVQKVPIFGPAGAAYKRAANQTYLAQSIPEWDNALAKMRLDIRDPEEFKRASTAFHDSIVKNAPNPALAAGSSAHIASEASQQYRGLLAEDDRLNVHNANLSFDSRLTAINDKMSSLARQGLKGSDEYNKADNERHQIFADRMVDKRFKYPPERAAQELQELADADTVQDVIGQVTRKWQNKSYSVEAKRDLMDAFWGPGSEKLNLTHNKRNAAVIEGLKALDNISVEDKAAVAANKEMVTSYKKTVTETGKLDPILHNRIVEKTLRLGDLKTVDELNALAGFQPHYDLNRQMNDSDRSRYLQGLQAGYIPTTTNFHPSVNAAIDKAAAATGVDRGLLNVTALRESRGDPTSNVNKPTQYKGLFQLSETEFRRYNPTGNIFNADDNALAAAKKMKAESARFANDYGRQPMPIDSYMLHQQGEAGYRSHLDNPDKLAWQNMLATVEGQQKGAGWAREAIRGNLPDKYKSQADTMTSREFVNIWRARIEGGTLTQPAEPQTPAPEMVPGRGVPIDIENSHAAKLWFDQEHEVRQRLSKTIEARADQLVEYMTKDTGKLADGEIEDFVNNAYITGRFDLVEKVAKAADVRELAAKTIQEGQQSGTSAAMHAQFEALRAGGINPASRDTIKKSLALADSGAKNMQKNTLVEASNRGWIPPINPIHIDQDPKGAVNELVRREGDLLKVRENDRSLGHVSVVGEDEAEELKKQLTQGDPKKAEAFLSELPGKMNKDNFLALMRTGPMKEALSGMVHSNDPDRLDAGMKTYDGMMKENPAEFEQYFGKEMDRVQQWQAWQNSSNKAEMVARFQRYDDPSVAAGRKAAKEDAEKTLKGITTNDMAVAMGSSWPITPAWLGRAIGSDPYAPVSSPLVNDGVQAGMFRSDFSRIYTDFRSKGMEDSEAQKATAAKLKTYWGPSVVNGNALMRRPPENSYKAVDGSHQWMMRQAEEDVASVKGPQMVPSGMVDEFGHQLMAPAWSIKALFSDDQTDRDIAAGKKPSYQLIVHNNTTGLDEVLASPDGSKRINFDEKKAQDEYNKGFAVKQQRAVEQRNTIEHPMMQQFGDFGLTLTPDAHVPYEDSWVPDKGGFAERLLALGLKHTGGIEDKRRGSGRFFGASAPAKLNGKGNKSVMDKELGIGDIKDTRDDLDRELDEMFKKPGS